MTPMRLRLALTCLFALAIGRCGAPEGENIAPGTGVQLPRFHAQQSSGTVRFEKKTVRRSIEQPAQNVEAYQSAPLFPRVAAYVKKVHVDIGDHVKVGQVLIDLSAPELDAE